MNLKHKLDNYISLLVNIFNRFKWLFLILFVFILFKVFDKGFLTAMVNSGDMQWFPAVLFWDGLNPYTEYLNRHHTVEAALNWESVWMGSQKPNYSHLLYILLYPLTDISWEKVKIIWAILSMFSFSLILIFFYRNKITLAFLLLITVLLLIGYPVSNIIGNGQITLIIALCVTVAWIYRKKYFFVTMIALSIAFIKYSFGLPILFGFFVAGYYKEVIGAILVNLVAVVIYSLLFDIGIVESLLLPIKVAFTHPTVGPIDLMSLVKLLLPGEKFSFFLIPIIYGVFALLVLKYRELFTDSDIVALSIFLSLVTFFHLGYDHVMFLVGLLIFKTDVKANNFYFIIFSIISILLWHCGRVLSYLPFHFEYACVYGGNTVYTLLFSNAIIFLVFLYLLNKIKPEFFSLKQLRY
jgi:hypothetical protein